MRRPRTESTAMRKRACTPGSGCLRMIGRGRVAWRGAGVSWTATPPPADGESLLPPFRAARGIADNEPMGKQFSMVDLARITDDQALALAAFDAPVAAYRYIVLFQRTRDAKL